MKQAILTVIVFLALASLATANVELTNFEQEIQELRVCDHNQDGVRDLTDVGFITQCKDSFDANEDGRHDLTDIGLYTAHCHDTNWCTEHLSECVEEDVEQVPEFGVLAALGILAVAGLFIAKRRN